MTRYRYKRPTPVWNNDFAYVIGLITTDGNLSSDGRHIEITSKDLEIVTITKNILNLKVKIGKKARGGSKDKKYFRLQFGDVCLYDFLLRIGLTPAKSKTIGGVSVPKEYFADYLRGCVDGDGNIDIFTHPDSRLPQARIRLASASKIFLQWILYNARKKLGVHGGWLYMQRKGSVYILSFGKSDSRILLKKMYYKKSLPGLTRKRLVGQEILLGE